MLNDLEACIEVANQEDQIRAIVITGSGNKVFCAGADRSEINNRNWRSVLNLKSASVFKKIRESSKISIAAINGAAVGGGFELAISCDLRIAQSKAQFWLPEPEFGLLPAAAATHLLPKYIGMFRAKDLILGGARWTADDALKAGLLSEVCDEARLTECVMEWVQRIQKRHPDAIRIGKQILELSLAGGDSNSADLLAQALLVINQRHT
jgi:enoyl-CoA hydratase